MNSHFSPKQPIFRGPSSRNLREASQLLLATSLCGSGAFILLPATADAAIIATPGISPSSPLDIPYDGDGIYLNVLNGASGPTSATVLGWDFDPYGANTLQWYNPSNVSPGALVRYSTSSSLSAGSLDLGTLVNSASPYVVAGGLDSVAIGAGAGEWKLNNANYFGFQFFDEGDSLGHFGWGIVVLGSAADATGTARTITNVYYESQAGVGIEVGALPIPEPTSSLLAAGAAGLALLRRRRLAA